MTEASCPECAAGRTQICSTYEKGYNGRCVYCDHEGACHKKWGDVFRRWYSKLGDSTEAARRADDWAWRHRPSKHL